MAKDTLSYVAGLVRGHDRDRFALVLTAPRDRREALCALFAFNYDIARTREVVTQPQLGLIRLQWWRDALAAFYANGQISAHEIMAALAAAIRDHDLPGAPFEDLLIAREFDLEGRPPATLVDLEAYAVGTTAPLNRLALRVLGQEENPETLSAVSAAWGLVGLLRAVPFHAGQGRCYLPAEMTEADSLSSSNLLRPEKRAALVRVVAAIADHAEAMRQKAMPRAAFLRASNDLAGAYLRRLRRCGYDPFAPGMDAFPVAFSLRAMMGGFRSGAGR